MKTLLSPPFAATVALIPLFVPLAATAQTPGLRETAVNAAAGLPAWSWVVVAALAALVLVALVARRKKRTTIIKTRLG